MRRRLLVQLEAPRSLRNPSRCRERGWPHVHAACSLGGCLPASGCLSELREGFPDVPADSGRALACWLSAPGSSAGTASFPECSCVLCLLWAPALPSCPTMARTPKERLGVSTKAASVFGALVEWRKVLFGSHVFFLLCSIAFVLHLL